MLFPILVTIFHTPFQDLEKFADESGEHGFIIFSLGSLIKSTSIPPATVRSFVKAFSQIPQRVIWKWESDEKPANLSSNVLTVKWLPQTDLLGKCFVTKLKGFGCLVCL